jgi:transposase-like protein
MSGGFIDWTELAPAVFALREKGLNLVEIARRVGVHYTTLYNWRRREKIVLPRIKGCRPMINEVDAGDHDEKMAAYKAMKVRIARKTYAKNREKINARRKARGWV